LRSALRHRVTSGAYSTDSHLQDLTGEGEIRSKLVFPQTEIAAVSPWFCRSCR
jgi:hypothetical protein